MHQKTTNAAELAVYVNDRHDFEDANDKQWKAASVRVDDAKYVEAALVHATVTQQ